jgi:hypothetical protein
MLILNSVQMEDPIDTDDDFTSFADIPMDGIDDHSELDEFLTQPLEKVQDPIWWWWEHCIMFPTLSAMALDYLSIPGASFLVYCK